MIPTICLNMIVKNESKTIGRLLASVIDQIDSVVISDTGSTDNTREVVETFMAQYPKKVVHWLKDEPFKDFGYNRSYSLKGCVSWLKKTNDWDCGGIGDKFILLMDSDMVFKQTGSLTLKEYLMGTGTDAFSLIQGDDRFYYPNTRIISNSIWNECAYIGVTHEYISMPKRSITGIIDKTMFFIEDVGDGGSKQDKFERDIRLLKGGLIDEPHNERYLFYLANSYKNAGYKEEAIETYKRRINAGGWFEEVWYSYYEIGKCHMELGHCNEAVISWLDGLNFNDYRIENLYEVAKYYCDIAKHKLAYYFALMAKTILSSRKQDEYILFYQKDIYDYRLDFQMSIICNYYNPIKDDVLALYMDLFKRPLLDNGTKLLMYSNLKHEVIRIVKEWNYSMSIASATSASTFGGAKGVICQGVNGDGGTSTFGGAKGVIYLLNDLIRDFDYEDDIYKITTHSEDSVVLMNIVEMVEYYSSTPTILLTNDGTLYVIVRFVNYKINQKTGEYIQQKNIRTMNLMCSFGGGGGGGGGGAKWKWLEYDEQHDKLTGYMGLEDIRLIEHIKDVPPPPPSVISNIFGEPPPPMETNTESGGKESFLVYNCNRGVVEDDGRNTITIECGIISANKTKYETQFKGEQYTEKNWVCFIDKGNVCKFVYKWGCGGVMTIGEKRKNRLSITHTIKTPPFFDDLRGSSNGIKVVDGEIWFICHLVSHESRRYYYHLFVVLDETTFEVLRYSKLWTFEKSPIEYCVSFIYDKSITIGYSVMDSTTKFVELPMEYVSSLFV